MLISTNNKLWKNLLQITEVKISFQKLKTNNTSAPKKVTKLTNISEDRLITVFAEAEDLLTQGLSSAAVELLSNTLVRHKFSPDRRAELSVLYLMLLKLWDNMTRL